MAYNSLDYIIKRLIVDLYDAKKQIRSLLPRLAEKSTSETLEKSLRDYSELTDSHLKRLSLAAADFDIHLPGKKSKVASTIITETSRLLKQDISYIVDAAALGFIHKITHYYIASYQHLVSLARQKKYSRLVELFQPTLAEEVTFSNQLTDVGLTEIYPQAQDEEF